MVEKEVIMARHVVNKFSLIGSLLYGLLCVFSPVPEVLHAIGYFAYFLVAAAFFFAMYALCAVYRGSIASFRTHFFRNLVIFLLICFGIATVAACLYRGIYSVSYAEAVEQVSRGVAKFFYYMPFLP